MQNVVRYMIKKQQKINQEIRNTYVIFYRDDSKVKLSIKLQHLQPCTSFQKSIHFSYKTMDTKIKHLAKKF